MEEINIESDAGAEIKIPGPKGTGYFFILTTNILSETGAGVFYPSLLKADVVFYFIQTADLFQNLILISGHGDDQSERRF